MFRILYPKQGGRCEVRLSGTLSSILIIGVANFLKEHRIVRYAAWMIGLLSVFALPLTALVAALAQQPITLHGIGGQDYLGALILGGLLTGLAILAGDRFDLTIEPPELEIAKETEEKRNETKDPYAFLALDSEALHHYYNINQSQARNSFRWAVFAMFCGLGTVLGGIWLFYVRPDSTLAGFVTTAAGIVINVISGLYLYLHDKTQRQSLYYYAQLARVQYLGLVIRLIESQPDEASKTSARNKAIDRLFAIVRASLERNTAPATKETS
jgi:hypothetical protein